MIASRERGARGSIWSSKGSFDLIEANFEIRIMC